MPFLLGVVVGILLTVGSVFVADSFVTPYVGSEVTSRQIVNWDVAKEQLHDFSASVRTGWNRLERGIHRIG